MSQIDQAWANSSVRVMHVFSQDSEVLLERVNADQLNERAEIIISIRNAKASKLAKYTVRRLELGEIIIDGVRVVEDQHYDNQLMDVFDKLFFKFGPNIVHIHTFTGISLLPILNAASSRRIRIVLDIDVGALFFRQKECSDNRRDGHKSLSRSREQIISQCRQKIFKRARKVLDQSDAIICALPEQKRLFRKLSGKDKEIFCFDAASFDINVVYKQVLKKEVRNLYFKLGHYCNSRCLYCVANTASDPFVDLSIMKQVLEEKAAFYDRIILTGGEPTLHPRFFDILSIIFCLGYQIMIQSNARIFSRRIFAARLRKFNVNIIVSVNSSREKVFDLMADAPGAFKQTIAGINNLILEGVEVGAKVIITKYNYDHLLETVKFVKDMGINEVLLVFPTPMGAVLKNFRQIMPRYGDVLPGVHQVLRWGSPHGMEVSVENIPACLLEKRFHSCNSEFTSEKGRLDGIYVNSNKGLYNCKKERMEVQKIRCTGCLKCKHFNKCEGVYREYVRNYGTEEFKPVLCFSSRKVRGRKLG